MEQKPSKPKTVPRKGCHRCRAKPAPGTPYIGSACDGCTHAESRLLGHGRGISFDTASPMLGMADDGSVVFNGEEIAPADHGDTANELLTERLDADEEVADLAEDPRRDAFLGFLMELAHMGLTAREAVFGLLAKKTMAETAKPLGVSFQAVHIAQRTAMRRLPVLRALLSRRNRR